MPKATKIPTLRGFEVESCPFYRICLDDTDIADALDEYDLVENGGAMAMYEERYVDIVKLTEFLEADDEKPTKAKKDLHKLCMTLVDGTICFYRP